VVLSLLFFAQAELRWQLRTRRDTKRADTAAGESP